MQSAFCSFTREALVPANTYRTFVLDLAPALEDVRLKEAVSPRAGGADEKRERLSRPGVGQQFFGCREEDDAVH